MHEEQKTINTKYLTLNKNKIKYQQQRSTDQK